MIRIDEIYDNVMLPLVKKIPKTGLHWFDPFGSTDFKDICNKPALDDFDGPHKVPDRIIMWIINVTWSIPTLLLVIAITLALGKGFWQVFIAVGLTMWVEVARIVRGQIKQFKERQFVIAAKVMGYNDFRIITKHILPNIYSPLIVISAANFAASILIESGLSFLGLGAQPPMTSWGLMIKDHYNYIILGEPFLAIIPGLCIMLLVCAFMLLGNSLRDILDVGV